MYKNEKKTKKQKNPHPKPSPLIGQLHKTRFCYKASAQYS